MLKILLCDDDPFFLSLERDIIARAVKEDRLSAAVSGMARSLPEAQTFIENNPGRYLIFLDLDFGSNQPNGIDISAVLKRAATENIHIVFTTNHHELAMDVLKSGAEPFGFLEKGTDVEHLKVDLLRYIHMALRAETPPEEDRSQLSLNISCGETIKIYISDILYLEAEKNLSHGITYHTVNGSHLTVISSLDAEAEKLGEGFLRVHRSYLAAKKHFLALREGYLLLSSRDEIPCSVKMRKEVKKCISQN